MRSFHCALLMVVMIYAYVSPVAAQVPAKHGMVVTEQKIATRVGVDILKAGGNAIDAAVAVGYALAVVNPCCGNIGGGGFMTIRFANGKSTFINFREKAPLKASRNMFVDKEGNLIPNITTQGYLAVAAIFLKDNKPYQTGETLIQNDLAQTLSLIAAKGPTAFYRGDIAKQIVAASQAQGGILTLKDFATYNVQELKPVYCSYRDYRIISAPLPSSGGTTLCEMLNILEHFPLRSEHYRSVHNTQYLIEAMRYGFIDRNNLLGDPHFTPNPTPRLISKKYAATLSKKIRETSAIIHDDKKLDLREQTDTTHFSVVDSKGNAVAVTYTLNGFYGAKVIAPPTGFFLNDTMDDFTTKQGSANNFELVQSAANIIQPGKRPLSSMTPTIVLKNNHLFLVLGSPGGPRIITAILLTLLNIIDFDMTLQDAIDAPRIHYQDAPDLVDLEPDALPIDTLHQLQAIGYHFRQQLRWSALEAIMVNTENNELIGANDYRRAAGAAIGY